MKALIKKERAPGLWMEDVPVPQFGNLDVLIKIEKTSICGTDMHIHKWDSWAQKTIPVPMVVGHEYMGRVAKVGKDVKGIKEGDRVSGEGHITCGLCRHCRNGKKHLCINTQGVGVNRPGCFGEYLSIPAENVFHLPNDVSDDLAAIFDPFGNATHTVLTCNLIGEDVLIAGAGPIGIMAAAIAQHGGARNVVITDINDFRLDLAKKMGVTRAVNISKESVKDVMKSLGIEPGFTVCLEMSGNPNGLSTLLECADHGANIVLLGFLPPNTAIDWSLVIFKMLVIKGIYGREIFATWDKMCQMLQSGLDISPIITHHFKIDDFTKGFEAMYSGNAGKIILDW